MGFLIVIVNLITLRSNVEKLHKESLQVNKKVDQILEKEVSRFLDFQKAIIKFPVRGINDNLTWIQSVSINQNDNEVYVARQSNGGNILIIEIMDLKTGLIKKTNQVYMEPGTYAEGLPWFYNDEGNLCFLVRQVRENQISIYNFTKNKVEKSFNLLGRSKIGFDFEKNYLITTNTTLDTFYIYSFKSVVMGIPELLHSIRTNRDGLMFEKPQGITMLDNKIIISHGASNGNPAISILNMDGQMEDVYFFEKNSFSNMVRNSYSNLSMNKEKWEYENEGIFMYEYNGQKVPALVQIVNGDTVLITLSGVLEGSRVERKYLY